MKKSREPWLDWDNSLELAKDSKERAKKNRPIKSLFWARFWLVLGLGFYGNLYLRRFLPALLWLIVIFVYGLLSVSVSEFASDLTLGDAVLLKLISLIFYLSMIAIEWFQLPKRVRKFNVGTLAENSLATNEMRGEIGRYVILKRHTYTLLTAYALSVVAFEIEEYMSSIYIVTLSVCLNIVFLILAISYIYRAYKLSEQPTN